MSKTQDAEDKRVVLLNLAVTGRIPVKMTSDDYVAITSKLADGKPFEVPNDYWPKIVQWLAKAGQITIVDAQMVKPDGSFDTTHHESPLFRKS